MQLTAGGARPLEGAAASEGRHGSTRNTVPALSFCGVSPFRSVHSLNRTCIATMQPP